MEPMACVTHLVSRDIIADSIEAVCGAQYYDALIALPGCDKNMPGSIMAMGRLNRPSIMVYGGTIAPGHYKGQDLNIVSAFEALGTKDRRQYYTKKILRICNKSFLSGCRCLRWHVHRQHDGSGY